MKKLTNKSGFTLIEIIVVLIIIGVLAAIALPSLFGNVGRSKAAEAIATMGTYKDSVEGCIQNQGGTSGCSLLASMGLSGSIGNFTYQLQTATNPVLIAFPVAASSAVNYVQLSRAGSVVSTNTWQCTGFGTYAGVC